MTLKPSSNTRRVLLGTVLAGTAMLATGCSSGGFPLASVNPFASNPEYQGQSEPSATSKLTSSIAATTVGARNQVSTMGTTVKSAWGKSTGAVTGMFASHRGAPSEETSNVDPLSLENTPTSIGAEVYVANGQLWESTGDMKKAMESYAKALAAEPNNAPALTSIARLHFRQGNHAQAAEFFQKAISQSPEDAGLYNDLGLTLSKMGNHVAASQTLERALQLAPGTSRYANNLASVKFESGDKAAAYDVLAKNNKPAVAHFNMAYLHFKNGQMAEARGHLSEAIRFEPLANEDSAVKRAVDRSRDMLAQIDGSMSPVAQAVPQERIAGLPTSTPVQQTSQALPPGAKPNVAPAASVVPWATVTPAPWVPNGVTAPTVTTPTAKAPATTAPAVTAPTAKASTAATTTPAVQLPTATKPTGTTAPAPGAEAPSVPFSLPTEFTFPNNN